MEVWKFECDDEVSAEACFESGNIPSNWTRDVPDTNAEVLARVGTGDGAVLATFDGKRARIFAVGAFQSVGAGGDVRIVWMPTPGFEVVPTHQGRRYWAKLSAHEITEEPRKRYGLPHLVRQSISLEASRHARDELIAMLKADGYTSGRLDQVPLAAELLATLYSERFDVFPSGTTKGASVEGSTKGTIRVESNGKYIAYIPGELQQPRHHLIGLAVPTPGTSTTVQKVPVGFDDAALETFALANGVPPEHLELAPKEGAGDRYIRISDIGTALTLIRRYAEKLDPFYVAPDDLGRDGTQEEDERQVEQRSGLGLTEREQLIKARRGQGRYRTGVLERFAGKCAVSGLALGAALRASHVLAWRDCENDTQRLDPDNGLLLSPDLDALFDRYLITFDRSGKLLRSPRLDDHLAHHWPLSDLRERPTESQAVYLKRHNDEFNRRVTAWAAKTSLCP